MYICSVRQQYTVTHGRLQHETILTFFHAKALPCVFNNCAVFYDGVFQTVNLPDAAWLRRLLKR